MILKTFCTVFHIKYGGATYTRINMVYEIKLWLIQSLKSMNEFLLYSYCQKLSRDRLLVSEFMVSRNYLAV